MGDRGRLALSARDPSLRLTNGSVQDDSHACGENVRLDFGLGCAFGDRVIEELLHLAGGLFG